MPFLLFSHVLKPKIIYTEAKRDGTSLVEPHLWGVHALVVPLGAQSPFEQFLGKYSYFGEAIHTAADLRVYVTLFFHFAAQAIKINDFHNSLSDF